ncbi:MAG: P13 family porin [Myxococcales bacterium]|nr:P13 family porin [Myxococcales bacterium]MCB9644253.1 P13 family porin [Myxococcales bacterium]
MFRWCVAFCAVFMFTVLCGPQAQAAQDQKDQAFTYTGKLPKLTDTALGSDQADRELVREALSLQKKKQDRTGWLLCEQSTKDACDVVVVGGGGRGLDLVLGLLLNIFLPFAIGSWVVGDTLGGIVGAIGWGGGLALVLIGWIMYVSSTALWTIGGIMYALGGVLMGIGYIVPIITVVLHVINRRRGVRIHHRRRRFRDEGMATDTQSRSFARGFPTVASTPVLKFSF